VYDEIFKLARYTRKKIPRNTPRMINVAGNQFGVGTAGSGGR
jgi:hypothetical protein